METTMSEKSGLTEKEIARRKLQMKYENGVLNVSDCIEKSGELPWESDQERSRIE